VSQDRVRYRAVENEVVAHYGAGRYAEGIALARAAMPELPGWRADLAHSAACLLARAGRPAEALDELSAALAAGAWWHRRILVEDDDLAPLRELAGFDELVRRSAGRMAGAGSDPVPPVVRRPAGPPVGLLVALHGAGEEADEAARDWRAAVEAGHVLLAVQSSQRHTPTYRSWPEFSLGLRDIHAALATLDPAERRLPLTAAGFSAGGRQAIRWALAPEPGGPAGFVAMAPAVEAEQLDRDAITAAGRRGVTGFVVLGVEDDEVRDGALATVAGLRDAGLPCRLDSVAGLGHAFPADFDDRLRRILAD
jgi:hypothetical protein